MSKENGTEANIITKKTKLQACVARGAGTSSIVIIQIYIYIYICIWSSMFLRRQQDEMLEISNYPSRFS
jgi:hypothetical protein